MSRSSLMLLQRTYQRPNTNVHHEGRDNTIELSVEDLRSLYSDSTRCLFSYMGKAFSSSECYCAIILCCPQASGGPYTWPVSNHVHITRKSRSRIPCGDIGQSRNACGVSHKRLSHSALSRLITSPTNCTDGQTFSGEYPQRRCHSGYSYRPNRCNAGTPASHFHSGARMLSRKMCDLR